MVPHRRRGLFGSRDIGYHKGITIAGFPDAGSAPHTPVPIGTIRITTTIRKAGKCTKATGITRITIIITGVITTIMKTITED
jgi:hypothetical protein